MNKLTREQIRNTKGKYILLYSRPQSVFFLVTPFLDFSPLRQFVRWPIIPQRRHKPSFWGTQLHPTPIW